MTDAVQTTAAALLDEAQEQAHTRKAADGLVLCAVRDALVAAIAQRSDAGATTRIVVALSGGLDSIVLLDALARLATAHGVVLSALHVHHGLSAHADDWANFCVAECAARDVPLVVNRVCVVPTGGGGLEATARTVRYAALSKAAADFVALAHHADDQAETLLLQLLRGAGPHGLAAMPLQRAMLSGPSLLRPFLALPRTAIDAYAKARALAWVNDESNANTALKRNFIRHEIATRLAPAFPGYPATLARSAAHQAETAKLIDELAELDAGQAMDTDAAAGATLDRGALIALDARAPHRARNLLRWFLRQRGLRPPSTARLASLHEQLVRAAPDARVRFTHGGAEIGIHRGRIVVHPPAIAPFAIPWRGEAVLALPHGTLEFASCTGAGIAQSAMEGAGITVRTRAGGERIRLAEDRPRQALKRVLHDADMPLWRRESLPLVFCGDALAAVPGIGVDVAFQAAADAIGYVLCWRPGNSEG